MATDNTNPLKEGEEKKCSDCHGEIDGKGECFCNREIVVKAKPTAEYHFKLVPMEPKEESTPDSMPDFEAMAREFVKAHVRPGAGYIGEQIFTGLIPGLQEHTKRAFELIWKEHYLPLLDKHIDHIKDCIKVKMTVSAKINKITELESELKNLREENERLQKRFDLRLLPPK